MIYAVEMALCGMYVYIPSYVKISTGIEAILTFCLRNLTGCIFNITDARNL
jgi:hypothetical protein